MRLEPPESDPTPKAEAFEATKVPSPPEEPPLTKIGLCGFKALPYKVFPD
jgi:hypothetical protein